MTAKNRWIALAAILLVAVVGAAWLARESTSGPEPAAGVATPGPVEWKYSVWGPPRAFTAGIERVKAILEEAGAGEFEFNIHYAGALSPAKEHLDAIKFGLLEGAHVCVAYTPAKIPLANVLELPFLLTEDMEVNARVTDAFFRHPVMERELAEKWNVKYILPAVLPTFEFMGNVRIASVDDLAGRRLRIPGSISLVFKRAGGVPVMVTAPETYTALDRGTVDMVLFPWSDSFGAFRLHEVSHYATAGLRAAIGGCITGFSLDAWNALPERIRALLPRLREEGMQAYFDAYAAGDRKWVPIFQERLEIVPFPRGERDKLVALSKPIWAEWTADMDARGLPGTEMLAFVQAQIAIFQRELRK
ncbi:MAG: TRAP transporter substrate-binding protein DctP [SAR324 cluster bacterium]|nr:TRAP transporter substrate-binding protein DctP [SAR324 cluster bacterium]